jgi:hypothetical protein
MHSALSSILRLLADLPFSETVDSRQTLIYLTGIEKFRHDINLEGSPLTFCGNLLSILHGRGRHELLDFLHRLTELQYIGAEQSERLGALRGELAALSNAEWSLLNERLPRIFITHDLAGRTDEGLAVSLRDGLEDGGYEVSCEPAETGDAAHWRLKLIRRLGACDGAVVILGGSQNTELTYDEALILRWREWLEEGGFKLVVVCLDDAAVRRALKGRLARLGLREEEIVHAPAGAGMLEEVQLRLDPLKVSPRTLWQAARMERILAQRFQMTDEVILADALRRVGAECSGDHPRLLVPTRLAREVLGAGIDGFPTLARSLKGALTPYELKGVLELLARSWVDLRSSSLVLKACRPDGSRRFYVNARLQEFTGRMYVRQAYYDASGLDFSKRVISVTAKDGDNVHDYILREIREGIVWHSTVLRAAEARDGAEVSDKRINQELEAREHDEGFRALPVVVLILFTGTDVQTPPDPKIEFLEPLLSSGDEDRAQITYSRCCDLLR